MKRDMDLIRKILLKIESAPNYPDHSLMDETFIIEDFPFPEISLHLELLSEAHLIMINNAGKVGENHDLRPVRLTWAGYEFLNMTKDENIWGQFKQAMAKTGGFVLEVAIPILTEMIKSQITQQLGLPQK